MSFTRVATRRRFLRQVALASGASMAQYSRAHGQTAAIGHPICAFVKFLQGMSFKNLAQTLKRMGYNGIEATVRAGGQVAPERVEDDLPKLVDALRQEKLRERRRKRGEHTPHRRPHAVVR